MIVMENKINQISTNSFRNRVINRHGKLGDDACEIMASAISAVDPYVCVQNNIQITDQVIKIGDKSIPIHSFDRIILIGLGKASVLMAESVIDILKNYITYAAVVTKDAKFFAENGYGGILDVYIGGHPIPTRSSIKATQSILSNIPKITPRDLALVLISGGGSALFTHPVDGISLDAIQKMTDAFLRCGADINEINTLRKHLDEVKGGGLALKLRPAQIHTLILSDVIGDPLDMIASGPTVPDPTSYEDSHAIIQKYALEKVFPKLILQHIDNGRRGKLPETLKPDEMKNFIINNHLIGSNATAAEAAYKKARSLGYNTEIISTQMTGDTKHVSGFLEGIINFRMLQNHTDKRPDCLIIGGETTVKVTGTGLGGRNQDLALRMVEKLAGKPGILFISLATDGDDGPTDAAGGAVDGIVFDEGVKDYDLNIKTFIENNDAYAYLNSVGGLIKTGSTGTNVNDLVIVMINNG
jgi:hydroxypyruvate reductase